MQKDQRIVIIGAGVFGLSTALELAQKGFSNVTVLDRHPPPVPDGSSVDISRIIRFDYADPVYTAIAKEAFDRWNTPEYRGIFYRSPFVLFATNTSARQYVDKCTQCLDQASLPWKRLKSRDETRQVFPTVSGDCFSSDSTEHYSYANFSAGWADARCAIVALSLQCKRRGVSFSCGSQWAVRSLRTTDGGKKITAVETTAGKVIHGDLFILATGAWTSGIVPMYNTVISTGQVLGFLKLTDQEVEKYKDLPICINLTSGWFSFPPHQESKYLKVAVHGWGYTNTNDRAKKSNQRSNGTVISAVDDDEDEALQASMYSQPPKRDPGDRPNFAPLDGIHRLRQGLSAVVPELATREFERTAVCWYTDTPTGDFIMDYHPDHANLFLATGGSGHAFKFLPVLGEYTVKAMQRSLPTELGRKWRFRHEYRNARDLFKGDGSRGGPARREFTVQERARL